MKSRLDVMMVKAHNRRLVFADVVAEAPTTRSRIAANTRLSTGTVATILDELGRRGAVREVKESPRADGPAVGRKPNRVEFVPKSKRIICVDLACQHPTCYAKDLSLSTESIHNRADGSGVSTYERRIRLLLEEIVERTTSSDDTDGDFARPIIGIGVSVPGPYRPAEDRVSCKLIPELNEIKLRALFHEYFPYPVLIDHDVKLALAAEVKAIPDHEHKTIISLFLGEGVGSAISVNGTVLGGAHEFAGEIGQMNVGEKGTLERQIAWSSFLSRADIPREILSGGDERLFEELKRRYDSGDPALNGLVHRTIETVARAIANIICILNPHAVIVSGHYTVFGDRFVEELQSATERYIIDEMKRDLVFLRSASRENPSMKGVGAAVREYWLDHDQKEGKP